MFFSNTNFNIKNILKIKDAGTQTECAHNSIKDEFDGDVAQTQCEYSVTVRTVCNDCHIVLNTKYAQGEKHSYKVPGSNKRTATCNDCGR